MTLKDLPLQEKPREKLLRSGVASLSEVELLAIFIQTGTKGKTAIDIARSLILEHKSLRNILNLPATRMMSTKGIGKAKFTMLQAALELGTRYFEEKIQQPYLISHAQDAKKYLIAKLSNSRYEVFACLFLNAKHQVIKFEIVFTGTINYTPIYPRVIAQKALECNAKAVIFAHNHPSSSCIPSEYDIKTTKELIEILKILEIGVLDHIVVGGNECCSFAELGLI